MRIYYCDCGGRVESVPNKISKCKCGKIFGITGKVSDHINMRNTWSGQPKVEFNQMTMKEDIAQRNRR